MRIANKKVKFNYRLLEKYEAGVVLSGGEVKAIKKGNVDLTQAYAKIIDGEIFLINANIPVEGKKNYTPTRTRKLLLHKKQIVSIQTKAKAKKLTLVPVRIYTKGRLVKVEISLAKPKRKHDKKAVIKKRDIEREIERELREDKRQHANLKRA